MTTQEIKREYRLSLIMGLILFTTLVVMLTSLSSTKTNDAEKVKIEMTLPVEEG